jgi:hypothetical protein
MFLVFEDRPSDSPLIQRILHDGDRLDDAAFQDLIRAAVALDSGKAKPATPKKKSPRKEGR